MYLSGPMEGVPDSNYPAFREACRVLRTVGHRIVSPHEVVHADTVWEACLRRDLIAMLVRCDALVLLPGWRASKGATLELTVATALGFTVYDYVEGELVKHDAG